MHAYQCLLAQQARCHEQLLSPPAPVCRRHASAWTFPRRSTPPISRHAPPGSNAVQWPPRAAGDGRTLSHRHMQAGAREKSSCSTPGLLLELGCCVLFRLLGRPIHKSRLHVPGQRAAFASGGAWWTGGAGLMNMLKLFFRGSTWQHHHAAIDVCATSTHRAAIDVSTQEKRLLQSFKPQPQRPPRRPRAVARFGRSSLCAGAASRPLARHAAHYAQGGRGTVSHPAREWAPKHPGKAGASPLYTCSSLRAFRFTVPGLAVSKHTGSFHWQPPPCRLAGNRLYCAWLRRPHQRQPRRGCRSASRQPGAAAMDSTGSTSSGSPRVLSGAAASGQVRVSY